MLTFHLFQFYCPIPSPYHLPSDLMQKPPTWFLYFPVSYRQSILYKSLQKLTILTLKFNILMCCIRPSNFVLIWLLSTFPTLHVSLTLLQLYQSSYSSLLTFISAFNTFIPAVLLPFPGMCSPHFFSWLSHLLKWHSIIIPSPDHLL